MDDVALIQNLVLIDVRQSRTTTVTCFLEGENYRYVFAQYYDEGLIITHKFQMTVSNELSQEDIRKFYDICMRRMNLSKIVHIQ